MDLNAGELNLGDSKTGVRSVPLSPSAVKVLAELPRAPGPLSRSPAHMTAAGEAVAGGMAPDPAEVVCGAVRDLGGQSATCAMAIYEHLPERLIPLV